MFNRLRIRSVILAFGVFLGLAITVFSVVPLNRLALGTRTRSMSPEDIQRAAHLHLGVHLFLFGALAAFAWFATEGKTGKAIGMAVTMVLGYGTEYLQHDVYGMPLEVNDIVANLVSSTAVFAFLALIYYCRRFYVGDYSGRK